MLTVDNLGCARGPRTLFAGLSFSASAGEWVCVTGPNGSGKTTLLRALAGLTRPESGTIGWAGGSVGEIRAYLGHAPGWKDTLTVTENLQLAWELDGEMAAASAGDRDAATRAALARAGLERQRNLAIARLSQGQRKRLHLARLVHSTRPLWLLDEPTAALDEDGARICCDLVSSHLSNGGVAVVVTHLRLPIAARSHDVAMRAE